MVLVDLIGHLLQKFDPRDLYILADVLVATTYAFDSFEVGRKFVG
jgi:hypothetical protein